VHMVVRSGRLSDTMSRYLIDRVENNPKVSVHYNTELTALEGESHLERVQWRNKLTGAAETKTIRHVFLMTGAVPNTDWLKNCLALDDKGFILTGHDLAQNGSRKSWGLATRQPLLLETSLPGVFAVGDARSGNVKRVASAVGEGSISVHLVHRVLAEM